MNKTPTVARCLCALLFVFAAAMPAAANERLYEQCLARVDDNWNKCIDRAGDDHTKKSLCDTRRSTQRSECNIDRQRRQNEEQRRQNEDRR